jgi:hypothetical protein
MRYAQITQTATNTTTNSVQTIPTPDDNNVRTLKTIFVGPASAAGLLVTLRRAGFQLAQLDSLIFEQANAVIPVNEMFPATIQFSIDFANNSGGTVTAVPIIVGYEVGDTTGQPISNSVP